MTLQIRGIPAGRHLSYLNGAALLEEVANAGRGCGGCHPHFEFTREYGVQSSYRL